MALVFTAIGVYCSMRDPAKGSAVEATPAPTHPTRVCREAPPAKPCRTVREMERLLEDPYLEILAVRKTPSGAQGAMVMTLRAPSSPAVVFRAKWRPHRGETRRNSPRREVAAYQIQRIFLEPHEYVVPPSSPHCFPLEHYRAKVSAGAEPVSRFVPCVYGVVSWWLEDAQPIGPILNPVLFTENRPYRDSMSALNVLTYLIAHADGHQSNFVASKDRARRVYSVDNNRSLGLEKDWTLEADDDWSRIRVPALRKVHVTRLRAVEPEDLRFLAEADLDPDEIAAVHDRIRTLIDRVDRGEIRVY